MSNRKAKRLLNESDNYLIFTEKNKGEEKHYTTFYENIEAWEVLLNIAVADRHIRETLRNIIKIADENIADNGVEGQS